MPIEVWAVVARRLHAFINEEDVDATPIVARPTLIAGATT